MDMVYYTPSEEELLPHRKLTCIYPGCGSTFTNVGNLDLHVKRHHGEQPMKRLDIKGKEYLFHCPEPNCVYHVDHTTKRHFKTLKYLRQHYQKVHVAKTNVCDKCDKGFISDKQLKVHLVKMCGIKYICKDCGWEYNSLEALLTHGKRNGHRVRDIPITETSTQLKRKKLSMDLLTENQDQETQTDKMPAPKSFAECSLLEENSGVYTDLVYGKNVSTTTQSSSDIETQTEHRMINPLRYPAFNTSAPTMPACLSSGQLLPPSTHTYTQTYDDLFSDSLLGFTDIQTQTNWSSFSDVAGDTESSEVVNQYNTSSAGTCTRCAYDELLVSTETQTSFTQCLLDSRTTNGDTEDGTFANLYQTQHTQTCDMLLGALFGAQESDLIGGYQSTYTQT